MNTDVIENTETIETIENVTYYDIMEVECTDIITRIYDIKLKDSEKTTKFKDSEKTIKIVEYTLYFTGTGGIEYKYVTRVYPYSYYSFYQVGGMHIISYGKCHYTDIETYHHLEDVRQISRDDMLLLHRLREIQKGGYGRGKMSAA
jgi:hypothetical protein